MSIFDPLYRYHADVTAYQAIDLIPDTPGVVTISGLANVDDESVTIDLGTNIFRFYGINFTGNNQLYISSNGLITFGVADTSPHNDSYSWWNWWYSNHRIAPLWDNWVTNRNTSPDDLVLYQFQDLNGDGVADQLVIEWNGVYHYDLPENDSATFQAILALNTGDTNGDIVFNYVDLVVDGDSGDSNYNDGGSATIGIWGGEYYNQPPLLIGMNGNTSVPISSGTAIRITSVPNPVTVPPTLVKDINAVSDHSSPSELTVFNGSLFFFANNGPNGHELYKTDALGNTTLVKDIVPGSGGSSPKLLTVAGSSLYFFCLR
jgi:ELWxxDGT repeat protein